jgi:hypothetical protein
LASATAAGSAAAQRTANVNAASTITATGTSAAQNAAVASATSTITATSSGNVGNVTLIAASVVPAAAGIPTPALIVSDVLQPARALAVASVPTPQIVASSTFAVTALSTTATVGNSGVHLGFRFPADCIVPTTGTTVGNVALIVSVILPIDAVAGQVAFGNIQMVQTPASASGRIIVLGDTSGGINMGSLVASGGISPLSFVSGGVL